MTDIKTLKAERKRYQRIVEIKKRHLEEYKKIIKFYMQQVQELDKKIAKLQRS